jgi:[ribosomal protein S5]-alanine N-acetyltransferase
MTAPLVLTTARLELVAATPAHLETEIVDPSQLAGLLGVEVPPGWPPGEYDRGAMEYFRDKLRTGGDAVLGWYGWYAIRRAGPAVPATLIGAAGYVGPPDADGVVEIGYSVVRDWQGLGYATEMASALVTRAWSVPEVRRVVAHTRLDNTASVRVLRRCGFAEAGPGTEPGTTRFELARAVR